MKRWICLLALLMLLAGCGSQTQSPGNTEPTVGTAPSGFSEGLYDPADPVEALTGGALRAYPLKGRECTGLVPLNGDLLLFGSDSLTILTGENLTEALTAAVPGLPKPGSGMVQVRKEGVAYYNARTGSVVFLSAGLRQTGCLRLTEPVTGGVCLTPDWSKLYYCTESGVQALDLNTGISRLLKAQSASGQSITGGFQNGSVLRCRVESADGTAQTLLISADTGETLARGDDLDSLTGEGDVFFLTKDKNEYIFGRGEAQPHNLLPAGDGEILPLPQADCAVGCCPTADGIRLDCYDLFSGMRKASVELPGTEPVECLMAEGSMVWLRRGETLYRWDTSLTPTGDEKCYTAPRYTPDDPDEAGLAGIASRAEELERRWGVEILIWKDAAAAAAPDYRFEAEYLTEPYQAGLAALEKAFGAFPENFFRQAVEGTGGTLRIALVRGIYTRDAALSAPGIEYLRENGACIALSLGSGLEQIFYHEVGHLMETRILSGCTAYYEWDALNPYGFRYDNDYAANQNRTDDRYLEGANRYFIDLYAMSFACEDRSRIFEYACMPGNGDYFASAHMQAKLRRICLGLRQAFRLEEGTYLWEQYLQT